MKKYNYLLVGVITFLSVLEVRSSEWQWSVEVKSEKPENGPARAWLWIPPNCKQVRGVVVAQHNMEEISILENPKFRAALTKMDFAEVWVAPFFDHLFRFNEGAGDTFNDMMNRLADESGYPTEQAAMWRDFATLAGEPGLVRPVAEIAHAPRTSVF